MVGQCQLEADQRSDGFDCSRQKRPELRGREGEGLLAKFGIYPWKDVGRPRVVLIFLLIFSDHLGQIGGAKPVDSLEGFDAEQKISVLL